MKKEKLLILSHSGGIDSSTVLKRALDEGYKIVTINFNYGQVNEVEIHAQKRVIKYYKELFPDQILKNIHINLNDSFYEPLNQAKLKRKEKINNDEELSFYMPSRNMVFAALSAMIGEIFAESNSFKELDIGLGLHKHSDNYPRDYWDITPEFADRLGSLLNLNDNIKIGIYDPYINCYKHELMEDAIERNVPFNLTWSCYNPIVNEYAEDLVYTECLKCEACLEKRNILRLNSEVLEKELVSDNIIIKKEKYEN